MDSQPDNSVLTKGEIRFPNKNRTTDDRATENLATFVKASADTSPIDLVNALEIKKPATVLLLLGGAGEFDRKLNPQVERLLNQGLALAAVDTNAVIIDGGTEAGVMELMGKAVALNGRKTPLLGVAPAGKVTYPGRPTKEEIADGVDLDPNHSHFVLVEGSEWSSGTDVMFKLVTELAGDARVAAVLINGGDETQAEVRRAAELGWPVVVVQGSGRHAEKVARDVGFANEENFEVFDLEGNPVELRQLLDGLLGKGALFEAWRRFAQYDSLAGANEARHRRLLSFTLAIGVVGTLFALAQKQLTPGAKIFSFDASYLFVAVPIVLMLVVSGLQIFRPKEIRMWVVSWGSALGASLILFGLIWALGEERFLTRAVEILQWLAVAVPVAVTILLTASNQFKNRRKWILFRGSAEAIRTEIFCYRTKVGDYAHERIPETTTNKEPSTSPKSSDEVLVDKLTNISRRLIRTDVNTGSLLYDGVIPPKGTLASDDNGFSFLKPERYVKVRLEDQLSYYEVRVKRYARKRLELQILIFIVGGLGTLLAAFKYSLWVALTTAAVTALSAWVGDLKLDSTMIQYNQSASDLSDLRAWWNTLSSLDKAKPDKKQSLVNQTEQILESERIVWVQQMEETTEEDKQPPKPKKGQHESAKPSA